MWMVTKGKMLFHIGNVSFGRCFLSKENAPTKEAQFSLPDDLESPSPLVLNKTVFVS